MSGAGRHPVPTRPAHDSETSVLFVRDTKGDRQNLEYGSLHHYSVPRYRTSGFGHLVGVGRHSRVFRTSDTRREVRQSGLDSDRRPRNGVLLSSIDSGSIETVSPQQQALDLIADQTDYVSLRTGHARKRRRLSSTPATLEDAGEHDHVDLSESASEEDGNDSAPDLEPLPFETFRNDPRQLRQRELSEATTKNADDVEAWFALIDLQDDIILAPGSHRKDLTASQRRSVIDLKISLYEQALAKVKQPASRQRLVEGFMRETNKVWDKRRQLEEWKKLVTDDPPFELCILYITFLLTNHLHFSYEQCLDAFRDCFRKFVIKPASLERDQHCIYLVLRLTAFMKQSGFCERAVAIWQGNLEFILFRPDQLPPDQPLASFEAFWNTEVARIGETGAQGWASGRSQEVPGSRDSVPETVNGVDRFQSWAITESAISQASQMPARTLDDSAEDDPYRVILYSDIDGFLLSISTAASVRLLLNAFSLFVGLPDIYHSRLSAAWRMDPFLFPPIDAFAQRIISPAASVTDRLPFNAQADCSTLFPQNDTWFSAFSLPSLDTPLWRWEVKVIQQLALARPDDAFLGEYAVALELLVGQKAARKLAKAMLKERPASLRLYNTYALVESRMANYVAAERVWSTALSTDRIDRSEDTPDLLLLWHSWIWECIDSADWSKAAGLLLAIPEGPAELQQLDHSKCLKEISKNSTAVLKSRRHLQSRLSVATSFDRAEETSICADLQSLLEYCHSGRNLKAALQVYQVVLSRLHDRQGSVASRDSVAVSIEMVHQGRSRLLHNHATSHGVEYRPKEVLNALKESVQSFPNNTIFLSLYQHYAQKAGIIDRLREVSDPTMSELKGPCLMRYLSDIIGELTRPEYSGSTRHSIRAAFVRATEIDSPVRSCPAIRMAHVLWEAKVLESENRSITKSLSAKISKKDSMARSTVDAFHDAIQACPWAKELYMICFTNEALSQALGQSGMRAVYESMLERGIRVHLDISDSLTDDER